MLKRLILATALAALTALPARAFDTAARAAWVYDLTTQTVLLDKNAEVPLPPASMSKLMTLNMLFEALRDGRVTLDTTFAVSTKAKSMGGSTMFLNETDRPTVGELIHGIIINSGNDACVVVAEGLAGSEQHFAELMTERAHALGMSQSHFSNASGWPDPQQRMSLHDLGLIATRIITEFPEFYPYFSMTEFNYKDRAPANAHNRNPLLRVSSDGDWTADGMKTGHTEEAGFGLVGSAVQKDGRRIVFVLAGMSSEAERAQESEAIANWAFRQFTRKTVAKAGTQLGEAKVHMGEAPRVGLVVAKDLDLLLPALAQDNLKGEIVYNGPLTAPIKAGDTVAELHIDLPDLPDAQVPLVAANDVARGGFVVHLQTGAADLVEKLAERSGG